MTITFIIATWNAECTLRRCLDSIVPQLGEDCELIVIDGGSTDSTNAIIHSYIENINYTVSECDNGIYDAWNKGIKKANGQWIGFIGADDTLYPDAIKEYLSVINSTPQIDEYDYICAQNDFVDENDNVMRVIGAAATWDKMRKRNVIAHVASLHNRKLFDDIGCYDINYRICADYELLVRKKNKLKSIYLESHIAKMKIGGMSFSMSALKEVYEIRRFHGTVSPLLNVYLYIRDVLVFKSFKFRKRITRIKV